MSPSGCRKGEFQCVFGDWCQEGYPACKNFAPKPLVMKIKGQVANSGLPGKWPLRVCACIDMLNIKMIMAGSNVV